MIVPLRPLPEASLAVAPDPSSNAYDATRPGVDGALHRRSARSRLRRDVARGVESLDARADGPSSRRGR